MLITDRKAPADVPEADPDLLKNIPDDLLGSPPPPAYLKLGTSPYAVDAPPERGDERIYCVKLVCKGKNEKDMADGKVRHERSMHCVKMWPIDEDEPEDPKTDEELAAENQPPLYDDNGDPVDGDEYGAEADDADNVVRPEFSDNSQ